MCLTHLARFKLFQTHTERRYCRSQGPLFKHPYARVYVCTRLYRLRLNRIHNTLLKRYDTELYHRMKLLDIAPQIYGL